MPLYAELVGAMIEETLDFSFSKNNLSPSPEAKSWRFLPTA